MARARRVARVNDLSARILSRGAPNPRPLASYPWHDELASRYAGIRAEWEAFAAGGSVLPRIEDVLGEAQGNDGPWRIGLLIANGRTVPGALARFPVTMTALRAIPGLQSALWSVLEPGTELPTHQGPNAGVLRYHFGVVSNADAGLTVAGMHVPYVEGGGILFDDTAPHSAWNRGSQARVTVMCEILRPLPRPAAWLNRRVQAALVADPRYRDAPDRAGPWSPEAHEPEG